MSVLSQAYLSESAGELRGSSEYVLRLPCREEIGRAPPLAVTPQASAERHDTAPLTRALPRGRTVGHGGRSSRCKRWRGREAFGVRAVHRRFSNTGSDDVPHNAVRKHAPACARRSAAGRHSKRFATPLPIGLGLNAARLIGARAWPTARQSHIRRLNARPWSRATTAPTRRGPSPCSGRPGGCRPGGRPGHERASDGPAGGRPAGGTPHPRR